MSTNKSSQDLDSSLIVILFFFLPILLFFKPDGKWIFFNVFLLFFPNVIFCRGLPCPASSAVPGIGPSLQKPFQDYLEAQRQKLHHRSELGTAQVSLLSPQAARALQFRCIDWGSFASFLTEVEALCGLS